MHFEKLSVLYNQLVQLESDIDKNSKVLSKILIEKKTIDDISNMLKNIDVKQKAVNTSLILLISAISFTAGCSSILFTPVTQMITDYKVNQEKQFKQIPIELLKQEKVYNTKLSQLQQKNKEKVDALIEDFEIQKIELQAEKNKAISQYKNLKANNSITRKLRELDVKLKLHKNKNDGIYTLYIDNQDRSIYIPSSSNNNISFKPIN